MALRHSEEIERRLRPEEAKAFLQVHAEREAAATNADAPTVEDLAEALGLTSVEARSILREARVRTAPPRPKKTSPEVRIASILLVCGAASIGCLLFGTSVARPGPPLHLASERLAPVPSIPKPVAVPEPFVQPPAPPSYAPPALSYVLPPEGFRVLVDSPAGTYGASGPTTGVAADYGRLGSYEAASVRSRLVATCLDLVDSGLPPQSWSVPAELNLSIALRDGRWTRLVVPVGAEPTPDDLRRAIAKVVEIAWPQIVRPLTG